MDNFILNTFPLYIIIIWASMFMYIMMRYSKAFKNIEIVSKTTIVSSLTLFIVGVIGLIIHEGIITWQIRFMNYGLAAIFTWGYYYHKNKFVK